MAITNIVAYRNEAVQFRGIVRNVIEFEASWNPDQVNSNSYVQEDISISGVKLGDMCLISFEQDLTNLNLFAHVKSAGIISVHLNNNTAGAVNLGAAQIHVIVLRPYHRHG